MQLVGANLVFALELALVSAITTHDYINDVLAVVILKIPAEHMAVCRRFCNIQVQYLYQALI